MSTDERIERLPKWAQRHISNLEMRVEEAERGERSARLATNPDESNAVLDYYDDVPIGLGEDARVRYYLGGDHSKSPSMDLRVERQRDGRGQLNIMTNGGIMLVPQASNVVRVGVDRW